jgi:glyoxylase-like metal-dependent hydrolase (beta-lactamase superfamily II)
VTPFQQNCSIVWCTATKKAAIIDPGGELDRIRAAAAELQLTIDRIWMTHAHLDHASGTAALAEALCVPIEGPHRADQFWIDRIVDDAEQYGLPGARKFTPDRWLDDGDQVTLGALTLDVIHCPGHTPGHVVFYHPQTRFAVVGDVLFQGSIGRTDFPLSDHASLIHAIRQKLFPLGDDVTFLPGHGPTSTFGQERRTNPFVSDRAVGA